MSELTEALAAIEARANDYPATPEDVQLAFMDRGYLLALIPQLKADAWQQGFKQGGPMHDVNYDAPDAHTRNPYQPLDLQEVTA